MSQGIDRQAVAADLVATWFGEAESSLREEAGRLAAALVDEWAAEADPTPHPQTVLRFQCEDLAAEMAGRDKRGRLALLRLRLLGRRIDRLNSSAFELGRRVRYGEVEAGQAAKEGRRLLDEAAQLAAELREDAGDPVAAPMQRSLEEAMLDALYAVERKAMSPRLSRA